MISAWWLVPIGIAWFCHILVTKDVYYGYGSAVSKFYNNGAKFKMTPVGYLEITLENGSQDIYIGHLGESVAKLLKKENLM